MSLVLNCSATVASVFPEESPLESFLSSMITSFMSIDDQTECKAWTDTLPLADRHKLTVYDAAYLELALRRKLPLATLDKELRTAAE